MKYLEFANIVEDRIRRGDYVIREIPTEDEFAREAGVSRKTVRRGLLQLVEKGVLARRPHGRLELPSREDSARRFQLAFLTAAYSSAGWERYRMAAERTASRFGVTMRSVDFVHWDDPVIPDALSRFDGVFLIPSSEPLPSALLERLSNANNVIALDTDLSAWKIPSVELLPPTFLQHLAEHLYGLGHRHIDCFNVQPHDRVMTRRIEQWQLWQKLRKVRGRLIDDPVKPYCDPLPHAYQVMKKVLDAGEFKASALVCLTDPAAIGAARAMHEHGLKLGNDVSLCAADGSRCGRYMCPSLTVIELPDPEPYLEVCLDWLVKRTGSWVGPLLIQPANIPLVIGESTGPPLPATAKE